MNREDLIPLAEILISIAEIHNKEFTKRKIEIYYQQLKHLPFEKVREALMIPTPYMPKPYDILQATKKKTPEWL